MNTPRTLAIRCGAHAASWALLLAAAAMGAPPASLGQSPSAKPAPPRAPESVGWLGAPDAAPATPDLRWLSAAAVERGAAPLPTDDCASSPLISGPGLFPFDLVGATTDGQPHNLCESFGSSQTYNDIWWRWQATSTGPVLLQTCFLTDIDTRLNVYFPGPCPPGDAELIGCNDDFCGLQSSFEFFAQAGEIYTIRLGVFVDGPTLPPAFGALQISVDASPSDTCAQATPITGEGYFAFDNSNATTDGVPHFFCAPEGDPQVERDVWWRWVANSTGPVSLTTCGLSEVETRIVVYDPSAMCPPLTNAVITCSSNQGCDERSELSFYSIAGQEYLIRLGSVAGGAGGAGQLLLTTGSPFLCTLDICQNYSTVLGYYSDGTSFRVAENWTAPASGTVSTLCFWGAYNTATPGSPPPDNFRITYYRDASLLPSSAIATFTGSQLRIVARLDSGAAILALQSGDVVPHNVFEYSACHAPVPVAINQKYWVEITNGIGSSVWAWSAGLGGNLNALQDSTPGDFTYTFDNVVTYDLAMCVGLDSNCPFDTNGDGLINFADLNNVIPLINMPCP